MDDKRLSDERAKFVTQVISKTGSALCCDNPDSIALSELGVVLCDAAEHIDILTAELAAAREEIERLKQPTTCSCGYCDKTQAELEKVKAGARDLCYAMDNPSLRSVDVEVLRDTLASLVEPEVKDGKR